MAFLTVDEDNFEEVLNEVFSKNKIAILKFGSEFCDPCHALEYELEDIDEEFDNVSVLLIDTDESPAIAERYRVFKLPTMVIYRDREMIVYHKEGVILSQDIEEYLR